MRFFLAPYPAVRLLTVVSAGILCGLYQQAGLEPWLMLSAGAFLILLAGMAFDLLKKKDRAPAAGTVIWYHGFVFAAFCTLTVFYYRYVPEPSLLSWVGKDVILSGKVSGKPEVTAQGAGWQMQVGEVFHDGKTSRIDDRAKIFVKLRTGDRFSLQPGDVIRVKGRPMLIPASSNRGEYDARLQNSLKRVHVQVYCPGSWFILREQALSRWSFQCSVVNPVRNYIAGSIDRLFPEGEERIFVKGMVLGERDILPDEMYEAFKRTGTAHVLAVSGLHVALLAFGINVCLQRMKVTDAGRWLSFMLITAILTVYSAVTGNAASVQRAAIMSVVLLGGEALGRKSHPVNSLAAADLLILILEPSDLVNPGFLMTNGAVLGILALYAPLNGVVRDGGGFLHKIFKLFWSAFSVSLAAIIGVSPVIARYFGTFSLAGIAANLPVVLFSNLAMYAAMPMLLFDTVSPFIASLFAMSSFLFARLTLFFTLFFNRLPLASIPVKPDTPEVMAVYAAIAASVFSIYRKAWGVLAISVLLGCNVLLWYETFRPDDPRPGILTVNLGRSIATFVSTGSETILIDAGRKCRDMDRIRRQAETFGIGEPKAVVQFLSPDSLFGDLPAMRSMGPEDRSMSLRSIVVARPSEKLIRIWSRKRSLLMVSGIERLTEEQNAGADVVMVWVHRFTGQHYRQLESWKQAWKPRLLVAVPGPFLPGVQKALLDRFRREHPGVLVRHRSGQIVVR